MDLYSEVALMRDLPEQRLWRGDVATVVEKLPATEAGGGDDGSFLTRLRLARVVA
ncbi:MAG: DUF4926 domain-containing protein [Thermoguttaceae bacterium]|nr:DUF4926 domain-containing protein [Thermoguttaceae bacterium]